MSGGRIAQIDVLKGLAMLAVLVLHTSAEQWLEGVAYLFHLGQPVQVFLVLMGMTAALSLRKLSARGADWPRVYYSRRAVRLLLPWVIAVLATGAAQVVYSIVRGVRPVKLDVGWETFIGVMPISGPGNYFVGVAVQWVLVAPVVWYLFSRWPRLVLLLSAIATATFVLLAPAIGLFDEYPYLYSTAFPRYLLLCVLGMWIADDRKLMSAHNRWMIPLMLAGVAYLAARTVVGEPLLPLIPSWEPQNPISYFYSLALVMLGLRLLPSSLDGRGLLRGTAFIGMASFHIFLVQIVCFGLQTSSSLYAAVSRATSFPGIAALTTTLLSILVCVVVGILWWGIEKRVLWDSDWWTRGSTVTALRAG